MKKHGKENVPVFYTYKTVCSSVWTRYCSRWKNQE